MLINRRHVKLSRRGGLLVLFGAVWVLLGYSYLSIPASFKPLLHRSLRFALSVAPIEAYGWIWIGTGLAAIIGGAVHRFDWLGFGSAMLMPLYWSLVNFVAQFVDGVPRAWVSGVIYGLLAAVVGVAAGMYDPLEPPRKP